MTYAIASQPFPVILQGDETGGYVANCPFLDGCFSQGETVEEALANITEAIQLCLEDARARGEMLVQPPRVAIHFVNP